MSCPQLIHKRLRCNKWSLVDHRWRGKRKLWKRLEHLWLLTSEVLLLKITDRLTQDAVDDEWNKRSWDRQRSIL